MASLFSSNLLRWNLCFRLLLCAHGNMAMAYQDSRLQDLSLKAYGQLVINLHIPGEIVMDALSSIDSALLPMNSILSYKQ